MTVSAPPVLATEEAAPPSPAPSLKWPVVYPDDSISILLSGDTGFGGHRQPVRAGHGLRHGRAIPFEQMTSSVEDLLTTDAAFTNLETVVTDHNRLYPAAKLFVFRSHPSGIAHLNDLGFNLFSTSNNHVGDYGRKGIVETLEQLAALKSGGREFVAAGLGHSRRQALQPQKLTIKSATLYLSAIGIGSGSTNARGRPDLPGQLAYRSNEDFEDVLSRLGAETGGYRMLSVHYGEEGQIRPSTQDVHRLRDRTVRDAGIDLVIGHHAHVARGVQVVDGKLIFYGLGNFMHPGMQDMAKFNRCRDFGLVARVHLGRTGLHSYRAMAVEVIPITGMHQTPRPLAAKASQVRVGVLNGLARDLDDAETGAQGVRFRALEDGRGIACFPGARQMNGKIAALCGGAFKAPGPEVAVQDERPSVSCSGRSFRGARYRGAGSRYRKAGTNRRTRSRRAPADYKNPFAF